MSELRQNLATGEWVIVAPGRSEKSSDFVATSRTPKIPQRKSTCPFCPGNEAESEPELFAIRPKGSRANAIGWQLRVVPNKYPALAHSAEGPVIPRRVKDGPYRWMEGVGHHEVIVEHPAHNQTIAGMSELEVERILKTYGQRYHDLASEKDAQLMVVFRNYGEKAGASLRHPHSQLITTGIVPLGIRMRLNEARRYFDEKGSCAYCDILGYEHQIKERLVLENKGYAVFVPYAAGAPYEMWLMPKRHQASFGDTQKEEFKLWAQALQGALIHLTKLLGDPDYNYILQTAPYPLAQGAFYHWHMQIIPHLKTKRAGFELGSGININIVSPEAAAKALREVR